MPTINVTDDSDQTKPNEHWTTSSWQFSDYRKDFEQYEEQIRHDLAGWVKASPPGGNGYYDRVQELKKFYRWVLLGISSLHHGMVINLGG